MVSGNSGSLGRSRTTDRIVGYPAYDANIVSDVLRKGSVINPLHPAANNELECPIHHRDGPEKVSLSEAVCKFQVEDFDMWSTMRD